MKKETETIESASAKISGESKKVIKKIVKALDAGGFEKIFFDLKDPYITVDYLECTYRSTKTRPEELMELVPLIRQVQNFYEVDGLTKMLEKINEIKTRLKKDFPDIQHSDLQTMALVQYAEKIRI